VDTSEKGLALIKSFEGCFLEAYLCPAKVWTIGYGHTDGVAEGMTATREQAELWLIKDVTWAEDVVERHVKVVLNAHQFDALTSFVFNVGEEAFRTSTLLKELNRGRYDAVPQQLMRWTKAGKGRSKRTLKGLVRRRAAEAALWQEIPAAPAPTQEELIKEPMPQVVCPSTPPASALAKSGTLIGSASAALLTAGEMVLGTAGEASKQTQESLDATSALRTALGLSTGRLITILVLICIGVAIMRRVQAHYGGKIG
jgi:lysozyme